jgi:hypothetical protein
LEHLLRQAKKRTLARSPQTVGARLAGYEAHHARVGNTRETFNAATDPDGSFLLVWFEGDLEKAFVDLATDDSDFMTWFSRSGSRRDRRRPRRAARRTGA